MVACSSSTAIGGSALSISTETATGSHILKIKRYSQSIGVHGIGESINSSVFSVGGHRFYIGYYPDGYNEDAADCISLDLVLDRPGRNEEVKARFGFSLLDDDGEPVPEFSPSFGIQTFSRATPSCGVERFIDTPDLEEYIKDDSFSVRCDVTVFKEFSTTAPSRMKALQRVGIIMFVIFAVFVALIQMMY